MWWVDWTESGNRKDARFSDPWTAAQCCQSTIPKRWQCVIHRSTSCIPELFESNSIMEGESSKLGLDLVELGDGGGGGSGADAVGQGGVLYVQDGLMQVADIFIG